MPTYSMKCETCEKEREAKMTYAEYSLVTDGTKNYRCHCGGAEVLIFDPRGVSFRQVDGPSGGWVSKAQRENKYRAARRQEIGRRERAHVKPKSLVPNFNGEVANSWSEAKDAAYHSTYERAREHGHRLASEAALESAKTFDAHVKKESA
jgi:hypothetical protein